MVVTIASRHILFLENEWFYRRPRIELRKGSAAFDTKLDALVKFTASVVENKGKATPESKTVFNAGYTEVNMIDV
jgi:hypothetical protein